MGKLITTEILNAIKTNKVATEFPRVYRNLLAFRTDPDYRAIPFENNSRKIPDDLKFEIIMAVGSEEELNDGNCTVVLYWNDASLKTKGEFNSLSNKAKTRLETPWLYAKGIPKDKEPDKPKDEKPH
jgi:hypothetical protein